MFFSAIVMCGSVAKGNDESVGVEGNPFEFLTVVLATFSICVGFWFINTGRSSLPRKGYLDPAITPTMAIMLCMAMFLFGGLGASWGASMAPEGTIESHAWAYASSMVAQIPIVLAYSSLRKRCGSRHIAKVALTAFIVFVPMALAVGGILHGIFVMIGYEPSTILGHETLVLLKSNLWTKHALIVVVCATIGAGIFEEVLYRGLILPTFSAVIGGKTAWGAIIATSILFALMHADVVPTSAMAGLFVLSVGLCWARVKSGGVLAPILIHIVFNAMNIAIVYSTTL